MTRTRTCSRSRKRSRSTSPNRAGGSTGGFLPCGSISAAERRSEAGGILRGASEVFCVNFFEADTWRGSSMPGAHRNRTITPSAAWSLPSHRAKAALRSLPEHEELPPVQGHNRTLCHQRSAHVPTSGKVGVRATRGSAAVSARAPHRAPLPVQSGQAVPRRERGSRVLVS